MGDENSTPWLVTINREPRVTLSWDNQDPNANPGFDEIRQMTFGQIAEHWDSYENLPLDLFHSDDPSGCPGKIRSAMWVQGKEGNAELCAIIDVRTDNAVGRTMNKLIRSGVTPSVSLTTGGHDTDLEPLCLAIVDRPAREGAHIDIDASMRLQGGLTPWKPGTKQVCYDPFPPEEWQQKSQQIASRIHSSVPSKEQQAFDKKFAKRRERAIQSRCKPMDAKKDTPAPPQDKKEEEPVKPIEVPEPPIKSRDDHVPPPADFDFQMRTNNPDHLQKFFGSAPAPVPQPAPTPMDEPIAEPVKPIKSDEPVESKPEEPKVDPDEEADRAWLEQHDAEMAPPKPKEDIGLGMAFNSAFSGGSISPEEKARMEEYVAYLQAENAKLQKEQKSAELNFGHMLNTVLEDRVDYMTPQEVATLKSRIQEDFPSAIRSSLIRCSRRAQMRKQRMEKSRKQYEQMNKQLGGVPGFKDLGVSPSLDNNVIGYTADGQPIYSRPPKKLASRGLRDSSPYSSEKKTAPPKKMDPIKSRQQSIRSGKKKDIFALDNLKHLTDAARRFLEENPVDMAAVVKRDNLEVTDAGVVPKIYCRSLARPGVDGLVRSGLRGTAIDDYLAAQSQGNVPLGTKKYGIHIAPELVRILASGEDDRSCHLIKQPGKEWRDNAVSYVNAISSRGMANRRSAGSGGRVFDDSLGF